MKNNEKYKTVYGREKAFSDWCNNVNGTELGCRGCVLSDSICCRFGWLDLEAEEDEPLPCPFCGSECLCENFGDVNKVECQNGCLGHYQSGGLMSKEDAIAAHNRVAKKCREGKQ